MKQFTPEMEGAYQRGLELSRREHRWRSMHAAIGRSRLYWLLEGVDGSNGDARWSVSLGAPRDLIEGYRSENEQAAFCAGWVDGAGVLSELSAREALEKISGWAT